MKRSLSVVLVIVYLVLGVGTTASFAAVIFQDDFESYSSTWKCTDGEMSKWSENWGACGTSTGFGAEWKMGPGNNSNNAVYAWKKNTIPNGYRSESTKWLSGDQVKREIYYRWYMKLPPSFDKSVPDSCKLWRFINAPQGSDPHEIYLNFYGGSKISNSYLSVLTNDSYMWRTMIPVSEFNDNQWHCHELRIKMNTQGASDGIIQYWLDGNQKFSATNLNLGLTNSNAFYRIGTGLGNCSDPAWDMADWTAIAFDDIVISTNYVGPIAAAAPPLDTTPPVVSNALPSGSQACATSQTLQVTTNESSTCKYSTTNASYDSMSNTFSTTGGTNHSQSISTTCGNSYTYFVRCMDNSNNKNSSSTSITFSVQSQQTQQTQPSERVILLTENFDNTSYASRGWYDFSSPVIDTTFKYAGAGSLKSTFIAGQNGPTGVIRRHGITPTDSVYVKFNIAFSTGWQGFGTNSPHMVYLLTTQNDAYSSLSWNKTTAYIEVDGDDSTRRHIPTIKLQDSENIDTSYVNQSRCSFEHRAVNGCNGNCDGQGVPYCYQDSYWFNGRVFSGASLITPDTSWHKVEAYLKMNTISGNVGQANGVIKMWWDGALVVDKNNVIIRTNENASMQFNQIVIAPWGSASPTNQSFWIDELEVANAKDIEPPPAFRVVTP